MDRKVVILNIFQVFHNGFPDIKDFVRPVFTAREASLFSISSGNLIANIFASPIYTNIAMGGGMKSICFSDEFMPTPSQALMEWKQGVNTKNFFEY